MDEIRLKARVDNLDEVLGFVEKKLNDMDAPPALTVTIDIAVEEMYVNIAHYAYGGEEGDAAILVSETEGKRGISITLVDSGMPYNPLAKEDPDVTLSAEERQIGGLGIYMVKKSMDEVSYVYEDGKNHFTMVKYFD